ncbi:phage tape measure protein [Rhizobium tropici CIAT 899]|nr:phage tape measure protein [Rhizobium tropici CIAT 899]NEV13351.1 tape measure protein [Rhizobium tropici]TGE97029.1 phage tail tape measure protein [Rhizobium sp. SEMIA 4088]
MGETLKKIEQLTAGTSAKMDATFANGANKMAASMRKVEGASRDASRAGLGISAAFAKVFAVVGAAKGFQDLADSSIRMTNALKVAGLQGAELQSTLGKLYDSALRNHAPIEALTTLYGRAALQQKELGASSSQLITFTDTVGKALRVSGTSAEEAQGSLLQLSQALGSGTVHAEEFNSIIEGMPALAQAAAKGIKQANGSVAELKTLVNNQQLSSRALFDGIIAGASDLDHKLQGTGATIGNAFTDLQTSLTKAAGKFDDVTGASKATVETIEKVVTTLNGLDIVKLANDVQSVINKLNEFGNTYDNLLKQAGSGPTLKERIDELVKPFTGGKPLIDLGPAFSNQPIDVEKLGRERSARQSEADADKLKALQEQYDAAVKLQKAIGLPVNNDANVELLRHMDEIRDRINAAKDALVSFKREGEKQGPPDLRRFQKPDNFKDELPPPAQVDITDPRYANTAQNAAKLKKAYDDLSKSAQDRNDQVRQEISLVGKSGAVLDAARTKLQLLQKAQNDGITGDNLKNIQDLADAYAKLSEELAGVTLVQTAKDKNQDLQNEIELVGKTGLAYDAAKYKLDLLNEARKNGVTGEHLAALEKEADIYAKQAEVLAKVKLYKDLSDQNRLAALPSRDRQIVEMQRQYGLPEDPNSATGRDIGRNLDQQANREAVTSFLTDFKDGLVKNGESIGKAFGQALQNALMKQADKLWENLFNQIANALFKTSGSTPSVATGVSSVGASVVGKALSGSSGAAVNPVTAGNMSAFAGAIKSIESSGNYGALGPVLKSGDRAYGAYQVMGANVPSWTKAATGTAMTPSAFLNDRNAQDAVFNKYFGASLSKYGNPQDAASVWFSGRPLAKAGLASDGFNTTPEYVTKFNNALGDASKSVGNFGTDIGQIGNSIGKSLTGGAGALSATPAAGGSLLSLLSSPNFTPNTSLGAVIGMPGAQQPSAGGLFGSLFSWIPKIFGFADGGHVAGPGSGRSDSIPAWLSNGEFVVNANATKKHRNMLEAINRGSVAKFADGGLVTPQLVTAPTAPTLRPRAATAANDNRNPGILHVQISGASGDDHVRTLVKQGVGEGLAQYNTQQRRGGFGRLQNQYANQKA